MKRTEKQADCLSAGFEAPAAERQDECLVLTDCRILRQSAFADIYMKLGNMIMRCKIAEGSI